MCIRDRLCILQSIPCTDCQTCCSTSRGQGKRSIDTYHVHDSTDPVLESAKYVSEGAEYVLLINLMITRAVAMRYAITFPEVTHVKRWKDQKMAIYIGLFGDVI